MKTLKNAVSKLFKREKVAKKTYYNLYMNPFAPDGTLSLKKATLHYADLSKATLSAGFTNN